MSSWVPAVGVAAAAGAGAIVATLLQRRRSDPPLNPGNYEPPVQLDRRDFERPAADWLVVSFTSATCDSCTDAARKVALLGSDVVATQDVEVGDRPDLHARYRIAAVPIVVIADREGVVRRSFVGPFTATHLWGAVAELREPGSVPPGCDSVHTEPDHPVT
jgi:hypothetical protein